MQEHNTIRWYFAIVSVIAMLLMTVVLRVQAASFKHGTAEILDKEGESLVALNIDIASTDASREKGLSKRESLEKNEGMLFIFDRPGVHTFWMKDMRFPIDIIWFREGKVVELLPDVPVPILGQPLPRYTALEAADAVLEVNRGFIKKYGVTPGMELKYTVDK